MHPLLKEVVDYLKASHAESGEALDKVIGDCANRGFLPGVIVAGIQTQFGISNADAKKLVCSHPAWGTRRADWSEFHEQLECDQAVEDGRQNGKRPI